MKVVILTWEYPPRIIGDMAHQVSRLAAGLAKLDVDITVVTFHEGPPAVEQTNGVKIHRVSNPVVHHVNILTWSLSLAAEFERIVANLSYEDGRIDVVDAHEWQCVPAATGLKKALGLPFVYTVYSLEDQRSLDSTSPLSVAIKSVEWLGGYESSRVVTRSDWVRRELERIHRVPRGKIQVVLANTTSWVKETARFYARAAGVDRA